MRLRKVKGADMTVAESKYVIHDATAHKGSWNSVFGNNNPIHIEIGMGKGRFITTLAALNPDINYIGIERYDSVLVRALEKLDAMEEVPGNLFFMCEDAKSVTDIFDIGEINRIYLNFSDPWPKDRHAKRRLTSKEFMKRYEEILKPDGEVIFKTDNKGLFDFSVEEIANAGWTLTDVNYDLHNSPANKGNVMTEYEEKFSSIGNPIMRLIARQPEK